MLIGSHNLLLLPILVALKLALNFFQGMVEPGQQISTTLKKEFMEEALSGLDMNDEERKELKRQVDILFQGGTEVFKGYVDDPRNTDVAWIETLAMNYHDDSGEVFNKIKLQVFFAFCVVPNKDDNIYDTLAYEKYISPVRQSLTKSSTSYVSFFVVAFVTCYHSGNVDSILLIRLVMMLPLCDGKESVGTSHYMPIMSQC